MRKSKEVELFGRKVKLNERNAQDVLNLVDYASKQEMTSIFNTYISAVALQDSLKHGCNWWVRRKFTAKKLLKGLTQKEIFEYTEMISEIEDVEDKKKVGEKESGEKSQDT